MPDKDEPDINQETILSCQDKISFDTKEQAETAATVAAYQHGIKLKVYLCKNCSLWHLSNHNFQFCFQNNFGCKARDMSGTIE